MKYNMQICIIFALVSCAVLKPVTNNVDKLNLLDKQGYEVISDGEEILTPVSPDKDNGVHVSDEVISKPEMLFYGRFYVLRKKGFTTDTGPKRSIGTENFLKSYPHSAQQYFQFRSGSTTKRPTTSQTTESINFLLPTRSLRIRPKYGHEQDVEAHNDSIFFPSDEESSTTKKYLRLRHTKELIHDEASPLSSDKFQIRQGRNRLRDYKKPEVSDKSSLTINQEVVTPRSREETQASEIDSKFETMNSEEFVDWAKDNLNKEQITHLLDEPQPSDEVVTTATSDIQYNSFIVVPGLKCTGGEKMNHRGVCTPRYVHIPSPNDGKIKARLNQGNAKKKLFQLLKTLKTMEAEVQSALKESETSDSKTTVPLSDISSSTGEGTTDLSITES